MTDTWYTQRCAQPSALHRQQALARQQQLTRPAGAFGRLETLAVELAAPQGVRAPRAQGVPVMVFAGGHGVAGLTLVRLACALRQQMAVFVKAAGAGREALA